MKGKRILIVDDDRVVLESCRRILESEGFDVKLVSTAKAAMEQLEQTGTFDMMIMDVKMPERDGVYLLEKITEKWPLNSWPKLPVLVMSGYPTPETIQSLIRKGAREFVPKPFTPEELLQAVYTLLKKSKDV